MEINDNLLSAIFDVARLIKEEMREGNCLADFTQTEIEILKFLAGEKNVTMKAIANFLHIKPSSVTPVVENLAKRGCIKRTSEKNDRRVVHIKLTAKGLKSLQKKYRNIHKIIKNTFGALSNNDKKTLIKIFKKIHENIT